MLTAGERRWRRRWCGPGRRGRRVEARVFGEGELGVAAAEEEHGLVMLRPRRPVPRPPCAGPRRWAAAPSCTLASARRTATPEPPLLPRPPC